MARGRARKMAKPTPRIGIDEKAFRKGQNYVTLLYDLDRRTVETISDGNDTASGNACFSQLSEQQIDSIEAISTNISATFVKSARENISLAETKIVHNRFHIMQMVSHAVNNFRRAEHKALKSNGDDKSICTRFVWLTAFEVLSERQQERFAA